MKYKISSYSGYFYVSCAVTGKLLIDQSFKSYDDAKWKAEALTK